MPGKICSASHQVLKYGRQGATTPLLPRGRRRLPRQTRDPGRGRPGKSGSACGTLWYMCLCGIRAWPCRYASCSGAAPTFPKGLSHPDPIPAVSRNSLTCGARGCPAWHILCGFPHLLHCCSDRLSPLPTLSSLAPIPAHNSCMACEWVPGQPLVYHLRLPSC